MNLSKRLLVVALALVAQPSFAEESRMRRLTDSYLIDNLKRDGTWATTVSNSKVKYSCLKCDHPIEVTIEVIAPYAPEGHISRKERYLSERKSFCKRLAVDFVGRCLGTKPTSMRGGALSGFRSEHEVGDKREIEVVFFYHERSFGPELIKAIISIERGGIVPHGTSEMLRWHMAKLTLFW